VHKCAVKLNALFNEQKMTNSDPLQCLIAVIVTDLKIMDGERARKRGYDHTTAGYSHQSCLEC